MLEKLLERLVETGQLKELTFEEVLAAEDGTDILVAEALPIPGGHRWSLRDLKLDEQVQDEMQLLADMSELQGRYKFFTV